MTSSLIKNTEIFQEQNGKLYDEATRPNYIYNNLKNNIMGTALKCKMIVLVMTTLFLCSCGGHRMKGSASDRTGTNGATNGTGKIPR